jgi:hypothetical protein
MSASAVLGDAALLARASPLSSRAARGKKIKMPSRQRLAGRSRSLSRARSVLPRAAVANNVVRLTFELEGGNPNARVVGQHPALGAWNVDGGVKHGDVITIEAAAARSLEYKWHDGTRWENGENRKLVLPSTGDASSLMALAVRDAGVSFVEPPTVVRPPAPQQQQQQQQRQQHQQHNQQRPQHHQSQPQQRQPRKWEPSSAREAPRHLANTMDRSHSNGDGPPAWYSNAVVYAIQTLGFCDCEGPPSNFAPGDRLERLIDDGWLEHVARLGCTVLYLGPLMKTSNELGHGYDTADYFDVDPRLGSVATLRRVVDAAHFLGIRVILDGVFNHTGRDHFAAQDVYRNGRASQYWDWYYAREGPNGIELEGWEGHAGLPRLNHSNPGVREHLFEAGKFWLSERGVNIDGWRLDVAHEVPPEFWRDFARACLDVKPDCVLLGELMHGDYNAHVAPGVLHSGTNYQLSKALWSALNDANYWELAHSYERDASMYGNLTLLNFLGNHDQARSIHWFPYDRVGVVNADP